LLHLAAPKCPNSRGSSRRNGRPRAAFGVSDYARSCIECKPSSSPRYTPVHSVIPLTGGRFDSRILSVRQECTGNSAGCAPVDGHKIGCPLTIEHPGFPVSPRAQRRRPTDRLRHTNERFRESSSEFFVHNLAGRLLKYALASREPTATVRFHFQSLQGSR
jgi:hypothetical protein